MLREGCSCKNIFCLLLSDVPRVVSRQSELTRSQFSLNLAVSPQSVQQQSIQVARVHVGRDKVTKSVAGTKFYCFKCNNKSGMGLMSDIINKCFKNEHKT